MIPREVAEAALAHRVGDAVEQAYRRGDALEKRRALIQAWADYLDAMPAKKAAGGPIAVPPHLRACESFADPARHH